jgi:hypothetical protein
MPTVTLTVREYNDLRVRAALAAHRVTTVRNGNPESGPSNEGAWRGIPARTNPARETRINSGDSIRVSVTGGLASARRGGRPRLYATPAQSNRARQRAYRQRRRSRNTRLGIEGRTQ